MPVSVACDSSGVMNAIRGGLASPLVNVNYSASNDNSQAIQNRLIASAKRVLFTKIEYEETSGYNESILDILKSKYIILKPNQCGRLNLSVDQDESAKETNQNQFCFGVPAQKDANQLPKPKKVLYPRHLVQIGWHSSGRKWQIGQGMINVGNTCYLNSTLQAVFHVPAMANWLMSDVAHREKCENEDGSSGGCIICAMSKTLISSQTSQSPIRPYLVYTKLRLVCKHLIMGRQEDAHEFLRYLVEAMEKSYLARIPNSKEFDQYSKETTPLNQILGGYLKSAVRCLSCGHVSTTFQHFQDILLDIRKANSIEEALDLYFARERLEDMGYKCEACKKKVSATKQFSLERAPISLCIQLKRFSMMGSKLNKHVTIRPRLDLSPYAGKKCKENLSYKLVAMVTHLGASQHCGHYTAIGLTESGAYYQFDDSYVRPISLQNVVNTNAYIIFYELDDNKEMNRQSSSITREINMFKQSPSRSDASTNGNENETQKQNFTAAGNKKPETEGAKSSVEFLEPSQKSDVVSSSVCISSADSFYKKTVMPNSTNSSKEGINGKTPAKGNELNFNSPSTNSLPGLNRAIQFEKPSSSSTKITNTIMNGISEDRLPNGLWSPKKFCGPEQFSPRKSPQVPAVKVNGGSTQNIHEYLHASSDKNDLQSPNKPECSKPSDHTDKTNVLSLVPYDSDDESESCEEISKQEKSPANSFKGSKNPDNSGNMSDTSSYYSKDYRAQPSKISRMIPSPPVVKTKAGLWKVSDISEEKSHKDESSSSNSINTKSVTKNPFASEPSAQIKSKDFYNGKDQQNHNKSNGRNDADKKEVNILHHLLKSPHQDHRRPVQTWWGQKSSSEKQVSNQPKQDRKRDLYDEEDEMMEAGRQKKRKSNNSCHSSNPGYNPFQEYQNNGSHQRRWNNHPYRRYRQNNNHRNNNFHRQGYNKKRAHRQRNHMDMNGYRHRRNS